MLSAVPAIATAPALVLIGVFMLRPVSRIQGQLPDEAIPAFLALVLIPFTYSIAQGIIRGFFSWTRPPAVSGRTCGQRVPFIVILCLGNAADSEAEKDLARFYRAADPNAAMPVAAITGELAHIR